ncbi:MAG: hypothetical protein EOM02_02415 [Synergistales bacterium]|nr:hypothetical protein [Synergistales bacterium]
MDILDLYTPATLTQAVNKIKPETLFLTKTLGAGTKITAPTESVMFDVTEGVRRLAPLGHNGDPATRVDMSDGYKTYTVTPPQIFLEDPVHASTIAQVRMAGQSPINLGGSSDAVMAAFDNIIGARQKNLLDSIERRVEWMFSQIISTGKIDYKSDSNGRPFYVDFGVPGASKFTISEKWDASTNAGDPLVQLPILFRTYAEQNGFLPTVLLVGRAAADAFRANPNVKSWLKSAGVQLMQINLDMKSDLVTPLAQIPSVGTLIEYSATYAADGTGTVTPYVPEDSIILTNPQVFRMHYGAIYDFDLGDNPILMAPRYSKMKTSPDGKTKSLFVESHPLPVITHDTGVMIVKVVG